MSGNVSNARAGDSPPFSEYAQPSPYATLLAKIEEVEAYTHTVLQQYPKIERYALCADSFQLVGKSHATRTASSITGL